MPFTDPFVQNPYPYAFSCTLTSTTNPGAPYEISGAFVAGVYTISWSGGGTLNVDFYNGTTFIGNATGTSSITYNLAQAATKAVLWNTVGGVSVVISLTALAIAPVSGIVHTYTASGTPGLVGDAYVVLVGGGDSGDSMGNNTNVKGGNTGGVYSFRATLSGAEALVIGPGGAAKTGVSGSGQVAGNPGTPTTFAGQTSASGSFGVGTVTTATASPAAGYLFSFFNQGTTGAGSWSFNTTPPGSGIGTGGASVAVGPANGLPGTGYGSGGGAPAPNGPANYVSGAGAPGVCYIILVA